MNSLLPMPIISLSFRAWTRARSPRRWATTAAFPRCTAPGVGLRRRDADQGGDQLRQTLFPCCGSEVTVLFCPPVLLSTLTSTPEVDLPYPLCRYIVPAGEAFPSALVEPWTRCRRQVINTYGPTEASTDTSRQNLRPGEPITSARLRQRHLRHPRDRRARPLLHGEVGELCIGGVHSRAVIATCRRRPP